MKRWFGKINFNKKKGGKLVLNAGLKTGRKK